MGGRTSKNYIEKTLNLNNLKKTNLPTKYQYWEYYGPYLNKLLDRLGHYLILSNQYINRLDIKDDRLKPFLDSLEKIYDFFTKGKPLGSRDESTFFDKVNSNIREFRENIRVAVREINEIEKDETGKIDPEKLKEIYKKHKLIYSKDGEELTFYEINEIIDRIDKVADQLGLKGATNKMKLSPTPTIQCAERNPKLEHILGGFQWSSPMGKAILIAVVIFLVVIIFMQLWRFRGQKKEIKAVEDTYQGWRGL